MMSFRTTGFTYLVKKLVECEAIDSVHDITIGYPAGLIQGESDLADGKMPKEGQSRHTGSSRDSVIFSSFFP